MHMLRENEKKVDRGKDGNPGYRKTLLYVVTTYKQSLNFIAAIFVFIVAAAEEPSSGTKCPNCCFAGLETFTWYCKLKRCKSFVLC